MNMFGASAKVTLTIIQLSIVTFSISGLSLVAQKLAFAVVTIADSIKAPVLLMNSE